MGALGGHLRPPSGAFAPDGSGRDSMPLADAFVNLWHASIPAAATTVEVDGLCTVQVRDGLISRNEIYFDRAALLQALTTR